MLAVVPIRVGDQCVLAVNEHGFDLITTAIQGGYFRNSTLEIDLFAVDLLKFFLVLRIIDRLKAGVVARYRTAVTGTLDVVLAPHWIDTGALAADVARHQGEVAQ